MKLTIYLMKLNLNSIVINLRFIGLVTPFTSINLLFLFIIMISVQLFLCSILKLTIYLMKRNLYSIVINLRFIGVITQFTYINLLFLFVI